MNAIIFLCLQFFLESIKINGKERRDGVENSNWSILVVDQFRVDKYLLYKSF